MTEVRLTGDQSREIEAAAVAAWPAECCGLLLGNGGDGVPFAVTRIVAAKNVAEGGGRDRFEVDPQTRFDMERQVRGTDERVIGHYHSHPDHPAEPSAADLARTFEPSLIWLIISVTGTGAGALRAWRLGTSGGAFDELELTISGR